MFLTIIESLLEKKIGLSAETIGSDTIAKAVQRRMNDCGIFDSKEMFLATYPSRGAFQSPALWSNNPCLIIAIQDHFEKRWTKAKESTL